MPRKLWAPDGAFLGGSKYGMAEFMSMYMAVYQLAPMGRHRPLAAEVLEPLRSNCATCGGSGLIGTAKDKHPRECSHCEGTGGFWNCTDEAKAAAYARVLAEFPEAAVKPYPIPQGTFREPRYGVNGDEAGTK